MPTIPLNEIQQARLRISPYIRKTPFLEMEELSRRTDRKVFAKCEILQFTGSFKIRGAANCILSNLEQAKRSGVVAASAGNYAQGVAAVCHQLGIRATIVMPTGTPGIKVQNTARWGAEIVLTGNVYDDSFEHAVDLSKKKGLLIIHPFHDPLIMAGQGTLGLELTEEPGFKDIEAFVFSVGGGGLISGCGSAIRALNPKAKVYGVTAKNAPATCRSFHENKAIEIDVKYTLAEGVAPKRTDDYMLGYLKSTVNDMLSIGEDSIAHAVSYLAEHSKLVVEGAGALPVAALLDDMIPERKVALVLSGGNIDLPALGHVLQRGLVEQGRLSRLIIRLSDRPGALHQITEILAGNGANIQQVFHQRTTLSAGIGEVAVEVEMETKGREHTHQIVDAFKAKGFQVNQIH